MSGYLNNAYLLYKIILKLFSILKWKYTNFNKEDQLKKNSENNAMPINYYKTYAQKIDKNFHIDRSQTVYGIAHLLLLGDRKKKDLWHAAVI